MSAAIKKQTKSAKTFELLGCTGKECMDYLETLFWPGMTRENYGRYGWNVDHIIPVTAFDLSQPEEQRKCFHYTNLQPLWWDDNDSKHNFLDWTPAQSQHELPARLAHFKQLSAVVVAEQAPHGDLEAPQSQAYENDQTKVSGEVDSGLCPK